MMGALLDDSEYIALALDPPVGRGTKRQRRMIRNVLRKRDGDLCHWCRGWMRFEFGEGDQWHPDFPTIEHVVSLACGGSEGWENLALAHRRCNQARAPAQAIEARGAATGNTDAVEGESPVAGSDAPEGKTDLMERDGE